MALHLQRVSVWLARIARCVHIVFRQNDYPADRTCMARGSISPQPAVVGKSAKDEIPQVVLDAINVFDDAMNGTRAEIVYTDDYRYVPAENDE